MNELLKLEKYICKIKDLANNNKTINYISDDLLLLLDDLLNHLISIIEKENIV